MVRNDTGVDVWLLDGVQIYTAGITALAGWPEPFPSGPPTYEDMHPAAYDAQRPAEADGRRRHLGPGALSQRRRLRQPEVPADQRRRAQAHLRRGLQRLPARLGVGRSAAAHHDHVDAVLGRRRVRARDRARRRGRASRRPVHRRTAAFRAALPRRQALGSALVGRAATPASPSTSTSAAATSATSSAPSGWLPTARRRPTRSARSTCS